MKYLIGIDAGTSSLKSVLFDEKGKVVTSSSKDYALYQPHNGWAEQNPQDWRTALLETLQDIMKTGGVPKQSIAGIGLSGQMHGLVMLDEGNEVIRPSIIWCDQRTKEEVSDMEAVLPLEDWISITGNPPLTGWTAAKLLWVKKHEAANYERCRHILLPKDYLRWVLTGAFASDVSDASGMQLMDLANRCWSEKVLEVLAIDEAILPTLYESCEVTGTLLPEIAELIGLSADTKVAAGAGDNAAAAIGTGIIRDGLAFTTIGTSGVVFTHCSSMKVDPLGRVHSCCAAVPNAWSVMGVTQAAGLSLSWFIDQFCSEELLTAEKEHKDLYAVIDEEIKDILPGSNRLLYLPYLMGERTPHLDPHCRGVFFGLSPMHTRAHLIHALMEGVAYSLADCVDVLKELQIHVTNMMACGGGGKNRLWRQMLADLYQCSLTTIAQTEGPALGAAILAGVGSGIYRDIEEACELMIETDQVMEPIKESAACYQKYHAVYKELYHQLKGSFQHLAALPEMEEIK